MNLKRYSGKEEFETKPIVILRKTRNKENRGRYLNLTYKRYTVVIKAFLITLKTHALEKGHKENVDNNIINGWFILGALFQRFQVV